MPLPPEVQLPENPTAKQLAEAVFAAVQVFINKRVARSEADLADLMKGLETALEKHGPAAMSERFKRLEERVQDLERKG